MSTDIQNHPAITYCSETCRSQDVPATASNPRSLSITSSVPPPFLESGSNNAAKRRLSTAVPQSPPPIVTPRAGSPFQREFATPTRPTATPHGGPSSTDPYRYQQPARNMQRDRRAFSFPATHAEPPRPYAGPSSKPMTIAQRRDTRPSQVTHLPFSRKPMGVSLTASPATPPIKEGPNGTLRAPHGAQTRRQSSWLGPSK